MPITGGMYSSMSTKEGIWLDCVSVSHICRLARPNFTLTRYTASCRMQPPKRKRQQSPKQAVTRTQAGKKPPKATQAGKNPPKATQAVKNAQKPDDKRQPQTAGAAVNSGSQGLKPPRIFNLGVSSPLLLSLF